MAYKVPEVAGNTPMKPSADSLPLPIQQGPQSVPMGGEAFMPSAEIGPQDAGFFKTPQTGVAVGDMTSPINGVLTAESGVAFDYNTMDQDNAMYPGTGQEMVKLPIK